MNRLILDKNYSDALVCAMYESKKITYEPADEADTQIFKSLLERNRRKKIKKTALIYALLYDSLELISPFVEVNNHLISASHYPNMDTFDIENFVNAIEIKDISLTSVSNYRDLLSRDDKTFEKFRELKNKHRKLFKSLSNCYYNAACLLMIGDVERAFQQIPDYFKAGLSNDEAIMCFAKELSEGQLSPLSATLVIYMHWIQDMSFMMKLSTAEETPFVTNRIDFSKLWNTKQSGTKDLLDIYEHCIVLMKQELPYIPQVNTYDDVLRIREKKELVRFKEVLNEWVTLMAKSEVDLASRMKDDIIRANRELRRYCEYRDKLSTFFFWFPLITSFIPIIPGALWWGIEQTAKSFINHKIDKYNWVGIGAL